MIPSHVRPLWPYRKETRFTGFTLLEIMIALFLFAIVVTTLLGSFNFLSNTVTAVSDTLDQCEMGRVCLGQMTADLNDLFIFDYPRYKPPESSAQPDAFRVLGDHYGDGDRFARLRFASWNHLPPERSIGGGIAEIIYYVDTVGSEHVLRRKDGLEPFQPFEPSAQDPVVCENVKSLGIKYGDADGQVRSDWDSESAALKYATPRRIEIDLEIGDETGSQHFFTAVGLSVFRQATKP